MNTRHESGRAATNHHHGLRRDLDQLDPRERIPFSVILGILLLASEGDEFVLIRVERVALFADLQFMIETCA
jgi:hypothetical protein